MRRSFMPWLVVLSLSSGCLHSTQVTWMIEAPATMKTVLLQHVPLGTPTLEAKRFMEQEGFACTLRIKDTFHERIEWYDDNGPTHKGIDFIECHRVQSDGFLMSRTWNIALVIKNDRVTDILVGHWVDGP